MTRAPCRFAYSMICDASLRGMPSVMMTISLMPASIASNAASGAKASGTVMTAPSTFRFEVISRTVS